MKEFFERPKIAFDYRKEAKRICDPYANKLAKIFLVYLGIIIVVGIIEGFCFDADLDYGYGWTGEVSWYNGLISFVCAGPLSFSLIYISKKVYAGIEPRIGDLLEGFKDFGKIFIIQILELVFIVLWSLLLVIPGIIKIFAYSMSYYVAMDNPNLSPNECLKESQRIMKGHKWELFTLVFGYLGWILLSALTLGILSLWVLPRIQQALYLFYLEVSGLGLHPNKKTSNVSEEVVEEIIIKD